MSNLKSVLQKFEKTIHENEKSGVVSGMYLSNVASRGPRVPIHNAHARNMNVSSSSAFANRSRRASLIGTLAERKTVQHGSVDGTNSTTDSTVEDQDGFGEVVALPSDRRSMLARAMSERSIKEEPEEPFDPFCIEMPATDENGFPVAPPARLHRASTGRSRLRQTSLPTAAASRRNIGSSIKDEPLSTKPSSSSKRNIDKDGLSSSCHGSSRRSAISTSSKRSSDKGTKGDPLSGSRHGSSDHSRSTRGSRSSRQESSQSEGSGGDSSSDSRDKEKSSLEMARSCHGSTDKRKSSSSTRAPKHSSVRASTASSSKDKEKSSSERRSSDKDRSSRSGDNKSSHRSSRPKQPEQRPMSDVERLASRSSIKKKTILPESSESYNDSFHNDSSDSRY